MRIALLAVLVCSMPLTVAAQERDEPRATELRARAQRSIAAGRLEEAFGHLQRAAPLTADPAIWLEMGDIADRIRLNQVAIEAYRTYLERNTDAANAAEIRGRVRVLAYHLEGGRYTLAPNGRTVLRDLEERPDRPSRVLVDWAGRIIGVQRRRPAAAASAAQRDLIPMPDRGGLGRALAAP